MTSVFLDGGWQTSDNRRGYKYTGDWEFDRSKFPDPVGHVKKDTPIKFKLRSLDCTSIHWQGIKNIQ